MDYMLLLSNAAESNEPSPGPLPHTTSRARRRLRTPLMAPAMLWYRTPDFFRTRSRRPEPLPAPGKASITTTCPE
jgi:hypothetical protein